MSKNYFMGRVASFFDYIFCEKNYFFPGDCSLREIKAAFGRAEFSDYCWLECGSEARIEKKSILFPVSHYLSLKVENEGVRCKIKISSVERFFLTLFLVAILLMVAFTPAAVLVAVLGSPNDHDLFIVVPAFLAVSIALVVWLKLICFALCYISGVSKLAGWVKSLTM